MRCPAALAILVVAAFASCPPASAQSVPTVTAERQVYKAFEDGDYARALTLIEKTLEGSPGQVDLLYNGACAHARLGHDEQAVAWIGRAISAGFRDYDHMLRDPDLASIRDVLEAAVKRTGPAPRVSAADAWRKQFGEKSYRYERDAERNLAYATALDEVSHLEMRRMLEKQADQMATAFFGAPPVDEVLIAVPTPGDARAVFGDDDRVGGIYQHTLRRLIARDSGSSLRHEFFHAYHWGHMQRLGQTHPLWIQEGMAALYEDYRLEPGSAIEFLSNGRHNVVKRRAKNGRVMRWPELMALSSERFMRRAGQLYPQTRSIFEFVADRGLLEDWYAKFVETFEADPTGTRAFESVFGKPLMEVEREWRRWVTSREDVDDDVSWGDAALGIEAEPRGSNDGVLVTRVLPGSAAGVAGIRPRDVIVSVDDTATRSLGELRTAIGPRDVGDRISVRLRRGDRYLTIPVTLKPLAPRTPRRRR